MENSYFSRSYKFTLADITFTVEIDTGFFAKGKNRKSNLTVTNQHPMSSIIFCFDDPIEILTDGKAEQYSSSIVIIPPSVRHSVLRSSDYSMLFSTTHNGKQYSDIASFFLDIGKSEAPTAICQTKEEIRVYLLEIEYLLKSHNVDIASDVIVSVLKILFYHIYIYKKAAPISPGVQTESYYLIINRLISDAIEAGADLKLSEVANELHLGMKHASRVVKKYFGSPLSEALLNARLDKAKRLLESTSLPISEVSRSSGFNSQNYFSRSFKKVTGMTFKNYLNRTRISKAEQLLFLKSCSVSEAAITCGYNSISYFIKVYRLFTGTTPYKVLRSGMDK